MRSIRTIAVRLSELMGVDASLSGDLLEESARGRSTLWYCKEVFVAIWKVFWASISGHKLLALRAIATGVAVNCVWLFLWKRFLPLRPPNGFFNLRVLGYLLVVFLTQIATGWIIARSHRAHAIPLVALFALLLLIWYLKILIVDSLVQPYFRQYPALYLFWLILTPLTEGGGLLAGAIAAGKSARMRRVLLISLATAVGGLAQEAASKKPEFEVATIKPVETPKGSRTVILDLNHGTAKVEYATLRQLIVQAYAIQRMRVMGGPDWFERDQYDLVAKAENPEATKDEVRLMLQALLADRFKLAVHRETRELPVYTLTVAKGGPHLQEAKPDEAAKNSLIGPGQLRFENSKIAGLVNTLSNMLRGPVASRA